MILDRYSTVYFCSLFGTGRHFCLRKLLGPAKGCEGTQIFWPFEISIRPFNLYRPVSFLSWLDRDYINFSISPPCIKQLLFLMEPLQKNGSFHQSTCCGIVNVYRSQKRRPHGWISQINLKVICPFKSLGGSIDSMNTTDEKGSFKIFDVFLYRILGDTRSLR